MRIALISHHRLVEGEGVSQKVLRTARRWIESGHAVDLIELPTGRIVDPNASVPEAVEEPPPRHRLGWLRRHQRWFRHAGVVLDERRPDAVYIRQGPWCPAFEAMVAGVPTIFEINSDPARELAARSAAAAAYWRWTWPRLERRAAGVVAVTSELLPRRRNVPSIVVANAVEVSETPPQRRSPSDRPIVAMPIGSPAPWHGLDHVVEIARRIPEATFRIFGAPSMEAPTNVEFLPRVNEETLRDQLSRCDLGLASLAMERAGLREACPLKSRTMLAMGLPIVHGYDDPDLPDAAPFAVRVDVRRNGLDATAQAIRALMRSARDDASLSHAAWRFAREHLDVRVKEHRRLEFIASVVASIGMPAP